jgi:hypothetical protein
MIWKMINDGGIFGGSFEAKGVSGEWLVTDYGLDGFTIGFRFGPDSEIHWSDSLFKTEDDARAEAERRDQSGLI